MELDTLIESLKDFEYEEPLLPLGDFHSVNTMSCFNKEYPIALKEDKREAKRLRSIGKTVGLALLYGGTDYTVSTKLDIAMEDATPIVNNFYSGLPTLRKFHTFQREYAKKYKCIPNIFGGFRYLPSIKIDNSKIHDDKSRRMAYSLRGKMERLALNAPIQSASAVQILLILITINQFIEKNKLNRTYGNLRQTYKPYTRVVSTTVNRVDTILPYLEELPDGHVLFLVRDKDGTFVQQLDRYVGITSDFVEKYDLQLEW